MRADGSELPYIDNVFHKFKSFVAAAAGQVEGLIGFCGVLEVNLSSANAVA